jgi:hypothetical protein
VFTKFDLFGVTTAVLAELCFTELWSFCGLGVVRVGVCGSVSCLYILVRVGVPNNVLAGLCLTVSLRFSGLRVALVGVPVAVSFVGLAFFNGLGVRVRVGVSAPFGVALLLVVPLFFGVILTGGSSMEK